MAVDTSANNKRIAKNALMLYFRMFVMMGITLYTSRVVLNTLGVVDYGVNNVVAGIVGILGFINGAMASATSRYITFGLGKGDMDRLRTIFSTALQLHFVLGVLVAIGGEVVGLWFLYNEAQIPAERMDAAFWVLQVSVVSIIIGMTSQPYNSAIIAHEKMSVYAYTTILDAVLRLLIVYVLVVVPVDKLILYSVLGLGAGVVNRIVIQTYCKRHFEEASYRHTFDKGLFKELTNFAGWSLFGNMAASLFTQGQNMLLNAFFGPVVNAARAVAVQVMGAVGMFVGGFQTALNPQITKSYAAGQMAEMHNLMFRSSRFAFYLLFLVALPAFFEAEFVLKLWLGIVPENTIIFVRIMILTSMNGAIANPLIVANQATGKVAKYQAVCGSILLSIVPISYLVLKLGAPAYSVFIVHFFVEIIAQVARMTMLRPLIGIKIRDYIKNIYSRVWAVVAASVVLPASLYFSLEAGVARFLIVCSASVICVAASAYFIGMTANERRFVRGKAMETIHKIIKR